SNLHTKINPAAFHGIVKICESVTRIARSVASNDQLAPAAHEFVHCQVLEVTSVRQVDIFTVIARRTEEFPQKAQETQIRAAPYPLLFPWKEKWVRGSPDLGFLRSEEHTSELQSLAYLVWRVRLDK